MDTQALIKNLGDFLDLLGGYYVVRFLIRDVEDVKRAIKALAAVSMVMSVCMINEQITHQNIFGLLGPRNHSANKGWKAPFARRL